MDNVVGLKVLVGVLVEQIIRMNNENEVCRENERLKEENGNMKELLYCVESGYVDDDDDLDLNLDLDLDAANENSAAVLNVDVVADNDDGVNDDSDGFLDDYEDVDGDVSDC